MTNEELVKLIQDNVNREENLLKLWDANKGIIHMTISKYAKSVPYEDLKQQAFLALCDAVENYRQTEASFTTYLGFWLRRYCIEEVGKAFPLSMDRNTRTAIMKLRKMQAEFESKFGQLPSDKELQSLLRMDKATYTRIKKASESMNTVSMDAPNRMIEDEYSTVADSIPDKAIDIETEVLNRVENEELHNELEGVLSKLSSDQERVLRKRYYENMSIQSVAEDMGISETEVRKYRDKAFRQIRNDRKQYNMLFEYYEQKFLPQIYKGNFRRFKENGSQTERLAIGMLMNELCLLRI